MQIIAFISGKGGVGKTTLTANTAIALAQRGKRVLVIDLDPQNALRLHLSMDPGDLGGLVREGIGQGSIFDSPFDVKFIPFGNVTDIELQEFEAALKAHPYWVHDGVHSLGTGAFDIVILDTPPGPTVYLQQAIHAAQRALAIVLADAASFATVPQILSLVEQYTVGHPDFHGVSLVINQMSTQGQLGHRVRTALYESYPGRIVPVAVHRDPAVSEALAYSRPVLQYEPGCKASLDIQYVADWILASDSE